MLERLVPNFDLIERSIHEIAPAGFVIGLNIRNLTPEMYHSTVPDEWAEIYTRERYAIFDPVMAWMMLNTGKKRWSEISFLFREATATRVMTRATEFGLNFGAILSERASGRKGRKSFLSAAREDREFTDEELVALENLFRRVLASAGDESGLTEKELEALSLLGRGLTHEEAGRELSVSKETIKRRIETARKRLGARNATEAVALAVQRGSVTLSGDTKW